MFYLLFSEKGYEFYMSIFIIGVLILIGVIIYGTDSQFKENLHAGFGITIVAAVFAIAGAVFMWISPTEE